MIATCIIVSLIALNSYICMYYKCTYLLSLPYMYLSHHPYLNAIYSTILSPSTKLCQLYVCFHPSELLIVKGCSVFRHIFYLSFHTSIWNLFYNPITDFYVSLLSSSLFLYSSFCTGSKPWLFHLNIHTRDNTGKQHTAAPTITTAHSCIHYFFSPLFSFPLSPHTQHELHDNGIITIIILLSQVGYA